MPSFEDLFAVEREKNQALESKLTKISNLSPFPITAHPESVAGVYLSDIMLILNGNDEPDNEPMFYILSVKQRHQPNGWTVFTWWRPKGSGYVWSLDHAGKFTKEEVGKRNCEGSIPVPCEIADKYASRYLEDVDGFCEWLNKERKKENTNDA